MSQRNRGCRRAVRCASGCGWAVVASPLGGRMRERATGMIGAAGSIRGGRNRVFEVHRPVIFGGVLIPPCRREARHGDPRAIFGSAPPRSNAGWPEQRAEARFGWCRRLLRSDAGRHRSRPGPPPVRAGRTERANCGVAQSRPNPRGGSMLSSSPRSSMQIASSLCASTDSVRLSGRLSSQA